MGWITTFAKSSIGRKLVMSLTGIFLMLFLVVHLLGNLQLLKADGGVSFNSYAYLMTHNPLIKTISYSLYAFILWHAIQGIALWRSNQAARGGQRYAVNHSRSTETAARNMAWFGIIIFVFIVLHMVQFWLKMKMGTLEMINIPEHTEKVADLYTPVQVAFKNGLYVAFYVVCMVVIAFHLWHGFWSSLQTLGWNHNKYNNLIKWVGIIYSVGIPAGFALIPVWVYFFM